MKISLATEPREFEKVYRFRYSIYVEEMNRQQYYVDHSAKKIADPLDGFGHILVAYDKGILVGTLRINFLRDGDIGDYVSLYGLADLSECQRKSTSITTRFMIAKQYRSGTLAVKLSKAVFMFALSNSIDTDFIDCNPPLDAFFMRMGHKRVSSVVHPEYGNVVVMKLDLRNEAYLRSIGSPFVKSPLKPELIIGT